VLLSGDLLYCLLFVAAVKLRIFIDGASKGNPGPGGAGIFVEDAHHRPLKAYCKPLAFCTNNVAEATALEAALKVAKGLGAAEVEIFTDSQLLARQFTGQYRVKDERLKAFWMRIRERLGEFKSVSLSHVPREQNAEADRLANIAADRARGRWHTAI
jgi:ribonuclease HI